MRERIGIIGLGRMGSALAARATQQGFQTVGWSRSGGSPGHAETHGYKLARDLRDAVAASDTLLLSLLDANAAANILAQLSMLDLEDKLIVETSTISPDVTRRHQAQIHTAGGRLIDAPISGGPEMIADGTMGLFIGGEVSEVERFMKIAPEFSDRVAHVGGLGAGAAAKIVNNVALAGAFGATIEAVCLGKKMGLDLRSMMNFLQNSPGITPMVKSRIPAILGDDDTVGFSIDAAIKTTQMFLEEAKRLDVPVPALAAQSERSLKAQADGLGHLDPAALVRHALEK